MRARLAEPNSPELSLRLLHGIGTPENPNFTTRALQTHYCGFDADLENGRDLRQCVSLNLLQQKDIPVGLWKLQSSQQGALERSWPVHA